MKISTCLVTILLLLLLDRCESWRGNYRQVLGSRSYYEPYCAIWYRYWGCSYYTSYWRTEYYINYQCQPGWQHNGDYNCIIPICRPSCTNGGTCRSPNDCNCPTWSLGRWTGCSQVAACSYRQPCYPGDCAGGTRCTCEPGFVSRNINDGCINFDTSRTELQPVVGKSNVTLLDIRRSDNTTNFMFVLEGTNTSSHTLKIIWVNQRRFNNLRFEYESYLKQPGNLPERPNYVSIAELGIVESTIDVNVSKVARSGSRIRDPGSFQTYRCVGGFSRDNPAREKAICIVNDDQFRTLIEHGDWLNIKFKSNSGGFQKIINLDSGGIPWGTKYYQGLQDITEVQFNFDFVAPKHCSEAGSWGSCTQNATLLEVEEEFTKNPVKVFWKGWTDDLSGIWEYYVEIFKLGPDLYGRLTELTPLEPVFSATVTHSQNIAYPEYRPKEPGMYSVLMETRDVANNSRIARRFVLYDNQSEITLNQDTDGQLFISSAVQETGYKWQSTTAEQRVIIQVNWRNHFVNKLHDENKLLNAIEPYPIQFEDIEDDGVLFTKKYVAYDLDDHDGKRSRKAIANHHGIVKFEIAKEYTLSNDEPKTWDKVEPFEENTSFQAKLGDVERVRVWIRATDIFGNIKTDSTLVRVDSTPPIISKQGNEVHKFEPNVEDGRFNYTSRLHLFASDIQSGVHKLSVEIIISTPGKPDRYIYTEFFPASTSEDKENPLCYNIEETCFIPNQRLDLDNCWFVTAKSDLDTSTAVVKVTAYNQALLNMSTIFQIGPVKELKGLDMYSGPQNIRIESRSSDGFRIAWEHTENNCFGNAEVVLVLLKKLEDGVVEKQTYYTHVASNYYDICCLKSETEYVINFILKTHNSSFAVFETFLCVTTAKDLKYTLPSNGTTEVTVSTAFVEDLRTANVTKGSKSPIATARLKNIALDKKRITGEINLQKEQRKLYKTQIAAYTSFGAYFMMKMKTEFNMTIPN